MAATPAPAVGKVLELLGKAAAAAAAAMGIKETVKDRPGTRAREADCSEVSDDADCDQCLLINGRIGPPPTPRYIAKSNRINYDYQLYVANLHAGPERFGYVRAGDNSNSIVNIELSMLKRTSLAQAGSTRRWSGCSVGSRLMGSGAKSALSSRPRRTTDTYSTRMGRTRRSLCDPKSRHGQFSSKRRMPP